MIKSRPIKVRVPSAVHNQVIGDAVYPGWPLTVL